MRLAKAVPKLSQVNGFIEVLCSSYAIGLTDRLRAHGDGCEQIHEKKLWEKPEEVKAKKPKIQTFLTTGSTPLEVFYVGFIQFPPPPPLGRKIGATGGSLCVRHEQPIYGCGQQGVR
jgi:hypothetical protein